MAAKTYDPKQVAVVVGSRALSGFADGDMVVVDRTEDGFSLLVGADGESTRARSANKSGTFTISLLASSESNDYLSQLAIADEIAGGGTFAVAVKDNSGRSIYTAATAWIKKHPAGGFGKEAGTREWVIESDEILMFAAGN